MSVPQAVVVPPSKERFYIDVTTNLINTNTGVSGTNNDFRVQIEQLNLDLNKHYTVEVESFYYLNSNFQVGVYPIILSDIAQNIRVINTNSSVLYKSTIDATNVNFQQRNKTNNPRFVLPIDNHFIRDIRFQIVRSDDGAPFPLLDTVQITLLLKSV